MLEAVDLRFVYGRGRRHDEGGALLGSAARRDADPPFAIDGVALSVRRGGLVGLLGPNGGGKTTLLRLLSGTLLPAGGHVRLNGRDLRRIPRSQLARLLAVVPQETQLAFDYTVLEVALMGRYPHLGAFQVEGPVDVACALAALDATGTRALADRAFSTLSGGEKQRVVIASALAQITPAASGGTVGPADAPRADGRVLFLDEPTASLDLRYQVEVARLIRRLHDEQGVTIVLSTHDLRFASAVCEEVVLFGGGRVLEAGPPDRVLTPAALERLYGIDVSAVFAP